MNLMSRALIISGPSGSGKSSLISRLFTVRPETFAFTVSHTTRAPRSYETNGIDYHYIKPEQFADLVARDAFIETSTFAGNHYGTARAELQRVRESGRIPVLDVDLCGVRSLRSHEIPAVFVLILPPSLDALVTNLRTRGSETEEEIVTRLKHAQYDMTQLQEEKQLFDHVIVNEDLDVAFGQFKDLIDKEFPNH